MRTTILLCIGAFLFSFCASCSRSQSTTTKTELRDAAADSAGVVLATSTSPPAPSSSKPSTPSDAVDTQPRMATLLKDGLVAIFLEPISHDDDEKPSAGSLTLFASEPIITVGRRVKATELSDDARRSIAPRYTIADAKGRTCNASMDSVALVHRRPADDPTAHHDLSEALDVFAARMFDSKREGKSYVVLARFEASPIEKGRPCGALWAVAAQTQTQQDSGSPPSLPTRMPVAPAARLKVNDEIKGRSDYTMVTEAAPAPASKAKLVVESWETNEDTFVWARVGARGPGVDASACFALERADKTVTGYAVRGSTSPCPESPLAATTHGAAGVVHVWFAHAHARSTRDALELTYWPTLVTGPTGGI